MECFYVECTYDSMLQCQNGVCSICGNPPGVRRLAVDHCHETGKVRGLLCVSCNLQLGVIENQEWIVKAMEYLS